MWMTGWWLQCFPPKERQPGTELCRRLGVEATGDVMKRCRLMWHGHVERKDDANCVKACTRFVVEGRTPVSRPNKTWRYILSAKTRLLNPKMMVYLIKKLSHSF